MVTYTVFPFKSSGVAPSFHRIEQADDALAAAESLKMLAEHRSAVRVTVWREEVLVFSGPSAACAAWLATSPRHLAHCPAVSPADQPCDADCGRLPTPRS
ncbi:MAG: hypothetical protein Q8L66_16280 [Caulobacter sp.]|nr:hypothetical protein [Caulobacter sp.]